MSATVYNIIDRQKYPDTDAVVHHIQSTEGTVTTLKIKWRNQWSQNTHEYKKFAAVA